MKKKTILSTIILFFLIGEMGCDNENDKSGVIMEKNAMINFSDPALDGCGWTVNIENEDYHAINLNDDFKINELEVNLKYQLLSSIWTCSQWESKQYKEIEINKKR
ncbi:hypothetical protein [Parabacteroides sp. Marseille-P3160]|uniref:hypothetical protein n=1 Tax=Parabacteroides sp. Marseille-P3160 TaxID=1917887 RepID=UPI0009BC4498|nr:hypothetical protein [Parabacteroides sp. Marseille-P3160]